MKDRTATIGYYDESATLGGTTRYLFDLLGKIDRQRLAPVFFAPQPRPWHTELRALDVPVFTASSKVEETRQTAVAPNPDIAPVRRRAPGALRWSAGTAREVMAARRLFRAHPVDLLHSNNVGAEPGPVAAKLARRRTIGTLHVDPTYDLFHERESLRYRLLERACLRSLDRIIAVSRRTAELWAQRCHVSARRFSVIHNGIDSSRIRGRGAVRDTTAIDDARVRFGIPPAALVIGSIGRLAEAKGYEYLLRAFPEVLRRRNDAWLLIAGSGPLAPRLKQQAGELNIAPRTVFAGFRSDINEVLQAMDIYVQPSLCEAFPYSVLEAAAAGLPLVVSDAGGMPEVLDASHASLVIPARDSSALATALAQLAMQSPATRGQIGEQLRARVAKEFSIEQMCARTFATYDDLLSLTASAARDEVTEEAVTEEAVNEKIVRAEARG